MVSIRRRWSAGRAFVLSLTIVPLLLASMPAAAPSTVGDARMPEGMLVAASGPCAGGYEIDSTGLCTHGSDPVPPSIRQRGEPMLVAGLDSIDAAAVACDDDGKSGKRIQALYVHVAGRPNRKSTFLPSFRAWAAKVDSVFRESAQLSGGERRLRWVTNSSCLLGVPAVAVSTAAETSFGTMIAELSALGYNRNDRKYLVWFDSDPDLSSMCGIASVWGDDRPTGNLNDERVGYARADFVCWDFAEQHEVMHTLGAVQGTAPHASAGLHCTDEYDQMCYADGAGVVLTYPCPFSMERLFDCNQDDYFSTAPAPGSYLDTHWNVANSGWLVGADPAPSPPLNDAFAAAALLAGEGGTAGGGNTAAGAESGEPANTASSAPVHSAWYRWTPIQDGTALFDTCGSDLDTTIGAYTGGSVEALTQVAANDDDPSGVCGLQSRIQFEASGGVTYRISVDGSGAEQGQFALNHAFVPASADVTAPSVEQPQISIASGRTLSRKTALIVSWPDASDASGVAAYEVQRRKGTRAWVDVALTSPTSTSAVSLVKRGPTYTYRLRARDVAGNSSPWIESEPVRLGIVQETDASLVYVGDFVRARVFGASGGYVEQTSVGGRSAVLSFSGRAVAFVTTLARKRGMVDMRLDGGDWETLDLYAPSKSAKQIVWTIAGADGPHTLEVRITGFKGANATASRADVDAFLILD